MDDLTQLSLEQLGQIPVVPGQKRSWFTPAPQQQLPEPIAKALAGDPRLALAQQLMGQNDFKPVRTPLEGLAKMAAALSGAYIQRQTRDSYKGDAEKYQKDLAAGLSMLGTGDAEAAMNAFAQNPYLQDPAMQLGLIGYKGKIESEQEAAKQAAQEKRDEFKAEVQRARDEMKYNEMTASQQRQFDQQMKIVGMQQYGMESRLAATLAAQAANREESGYSLMSSDEVKAAGLPPGSYQRSGKGEIKPIASPSGAAHKPMNGTVMKQYNTSSEALKISQDVQRRLDEAESLFDPNRKGGAVDTGAVARGVRAVTRVTGGGTENTRDLGALDRMREKMRNDYLLLAKGVQTEGDAKRAIDALMPYTTDAKEIKAQIRDVRAANKALEEMHRSSMENIELEYGKPGGGNIRVVDW